MTSQSSTPANGTLNILNATISGLYANSTGADVTLIGSHFRNPLFVVPIVISAICTAAFIVLTTISWVKKSDVGGSRKAFAVMMTLLVGMTLSFARSLAEGVIHEYEPRVPKAFLILPALKPVLDNATDVTLLGMIYRIVKNRNRWVSGNHHGYKNWQRIHQFFVLVLLLVAIADTALYIYAQVLLFSQVQVNAKLVRTANSYLDVHLLYTTLYLFTSLEILACVIFIAARALRQKIRSRILTYLLLLVQPFLILRSATILALAIRYTFQSYTEAQVTGVVATALWGFPSIAIFTGLTLIQYQRDWDLGMRFEPAHGLVEQASSWSPPVQDPQGHWKDPMVQHYHSN